jgi:hypothetical protein
MFLCILILITCVALQKNFKKNLPIGYLKRKSNNQPAKLGTNSPNPENFKFHNPMGPFYSDWLTSLHAQTTTKKQKTSLLCLLCLA